MNILYLFRKKLKKKKKPSRCDTQDIPKEENLEELAG